MKYLLRNYAFAAMIAACALTACSRANKSEKPEVTAKPAAAAPAQTTTPAKISPQDLPQMDADFLNPKVAKEKSGGDLAWQQLQKSIQPPEVPAEWQTKEPSKEEIAAFEKKNSVLAGDAAQKVKDFYTKFPEHEMAETAKKLEYSLLSEAAKMGNTNATARLDEVESARLKDPNLSEDDRFTLRAQQLQRKVEAKQQDQAASLAEMETGVRQLQKEFPKRDEINSLLLAVAQGRLDNNQVEQSRALVEEVLKSKPEGEAKEEAEGLLKKVNLIGKPLALKYKALDARDVDVQQMKGKVVLVDFWATWCGPCMHELPHVKEAYQKLHDKGFEIVGISFDREKAALEKTVQEEKIPWPQFLDGETGQKFGEQFGISGIPTFWLVDKKGVLRDVNGTENLVEKVEKLLAEN